MRVIRQRRGEKRQCDPADLDLLALPLATCVADAPLLGPGHAGTTGKNESNYKKVWVHVFVAETGVVAVM